MPRWHWPLVALAISTTLLAYAATTNTVPLSAWVIHGIAIVTTGARYLAQRR